MNSGQAKNILKRYIADKPGFCGAVTELASTVNTPDVLALDNKDRVHEFEIKVSRQDLKNEITSARIAFGIDKVEKYAGVENVIYWSDGSYHLKNDLSRTDKRFSKLQKHKNYAHRYLRHSKFDFYRTYVPHKFSIAVPHDLVDYAKEFMKGLPYGIFDLSYCRVIRSAKILTEQPASKDVVSLMFSRAINEYYKYPKEIV